MDEEQKKNQWNELEVVVTTLTKLQLTLHHSWLAFELEPIPTTSPSKAIASATSISTSRGDRADGRGRGSRTTTTPTSAGPSASTPSTRSASRTRRTTSARCSSPGLIPPSERTTRLDSGSRKATSRSSTGTSSTKLKSRPILRLRSADCAWGSPWARRTKKSSYSPARSPRTWFSSSKTISRSRRCIESAQPRGDQGGSVPVWRFLTKSDTQLLPVSQRFPVLPPPRVPQPPQTIFDPSAAESRQPHER